MRGETRKMLNEIDRFLSRNDPESMELWTVLTALRGPDDYKKDHLKHTGTVHVRIAAFPMTNFAAGTYGYANGADFNDDYPLAVPDMDGNDAGHFEGHLYHAMQILEIGGLTSDD